MEAIPAIPYIYCKLTKLKIYRHGLQTRNATDHKR